MQTLPYWRLSGFYFFYFFFVGAFAPYWTLYLQSLKFDAMRIAILMSLLQVMRTFAPALWGWLADHSGKHIGIVRVAALLSLISYLGVFGYSSFSAMFMIMAVMSFFWSASLPLVEATTLSHLGTSISRYGRIRLWGSIGFIVAVVAIGYYLNHAVISNLLWIVLVALIGIAVFAQQIPEVSSSKPEAVREPILKILRQRNVIILFLGCFLMSAAHGPYYTFYSIYLVDHGYAKSAVGWLWALGVICEVAVFVWMSQLMKRFSSYQILIISFALAVVRFLLIAWGVDYLALMLLAQTLHAATFGAYHAAAVALIHQLFPGQNQAKGQALYTSLSFGAGGTFGGLISGYLWEHAGAAMTFSFSATLAAGAWVAMSIWFKPVLQNK